MCQKIFENLSNDTYFDLFESTAFPTPRVRKWNKVKIKFNWLIIPSEKQLNVKNKEYTLKEPDRKHLISLKLKDSFDNVNFNLINDYLNHAAFDYLASIVKGKHNLNLYACLECNENLVSGIRCDLTWDLTKKSFFHIFII